MITTDTPTTAQQPSTSKAVTTRFLDFWLLGGASLVVWIILVTLTPFRYSSSVVKTYLDNAGGFFVICFLLVNYPHFMASYKLAYGKGLRFICRNWWQLLAVPLLLIALIVHAFIYADLPPIWTDLLNESFGVVGLQTSFQAVSDGHGRESIAVLIVLMYLTVGWHYTKQVYGCMMVYSHYDGYRLDLWQRRVIKWSLFGIWFANYFAYHRGYTPKHFYGFNHYPLDYTIYAYYFGYASFALMLVMLLYYIIFRNYRRNKQLPSVNFLIPYVSLVIWWLPPFNHPFFYMTAVPFFHSLQYLPFVYRIESRQIPSSFSPLRRNIRGTAIVTLLIVSGWLSFNFVPDMLDQNFSTINMMNVWYFTAVFHIFINIHHYFIDNVIWRFDNPDIKNLLLK